MELALNEEAIISQMTSLDCMQEEMRILGSSHKEGEGSEVESTLLKIYLLPSIIIENKSFVLLHDVQNIFNIKLDEALGAIVETIDDAIIGSSNEYATFSYNGRVDENN